MLQVGKAQKTAEGGATYDTFDCPGCGQESVGKLEFAFLQLTLFYKEPKAAS
jgi:hypothetical protein